MKLLVVDGNSILNRGFYGVKGLTTKDGAFTNAMFGFLNILRSMLDDVQPDGVAIAFDLRAPTFRHKMYDGYKAQRKGMPEELATQLEPTKELLRALGYRLVTCEGYEADDILGTFARACTESDNECVIATGDRDSFQLIAPGVTVRLAATRVGGAELYDEAAIQAKYGVSPHQLIDVKALMGDASDNIPGVPGVGEKTALDLIIRYGDLDTIYRDLEALEVRPAVRQKLEAGRESAYMSQKLARIDCAVPIDLTLSSYIPAPVDQTAARALFARYELASMQKKYLDRAGPAAPEVPAMPAPPDDRPPLTLVEHPIDFAARIARAGYADLTVHWKRDEPSAIVIRAGEELLLLDGALLPEVMESAVPVRVFTSKPICRWMYANGYRMPTVVLDGILAAYLMNPNTSSYEIGQLAAQYGIRPRGIEPQPSETQQALCTEGALLTDVFDALRAEVDDKEQRALLYEIEMPLAGVLAAIECEGFALDTEALAAYGVELDERLGELQQEIYQHAGGAFNIQSPRQIGEVLFDRLGLPAKKKTKTGYSTNAEVLDGLRGRHPIVNLILEHRKLAKLKSTYVDGLLKVVGADGRVRSTFQQTETRTGRISSTEPNLQNIPVRTAEGSRMRAFFKAREGYLLLDADYSQIELRVLAHIADDERMIEAFLEGQDIHTATAAQVFDLPPTMVTPQMRSRAKAVNFGIVYGIGAFSLSQDIGVSMAEAKRYIEGYLETYSGVRRYMEETIRQGRQNGYVKTLFGRRRYLPELAASNKTTQAFGERVAMNTPIQGTAADIIKIAMIRVYERLEAEGLRARLILQVHDELLVEAPAEEAEQASRVLTEEMERALTLKAPLVAETHAGRTWLEAK